MSLEAVPSSDAQRKVLSELDRLTVDDSTDVLLWRAFVHATVPRIRGPYLAHHGPRQVLRHLETAFQFALHRPPGVVHAEVRRGPSDRGVMVLANLDDQPFIVDTIRLFLRRGGATPWAAFHVVYSATRDENGRLVAVGEGDHRESLSLLEADPGTLASDLAASSNRLRTALHLARATVRDFKPMVRAVDRYVERCEALAERHPDKASDHGETASFLKWLLRDNFVFMGLRGPNGALGIEAEEGPFRGDPGSHWTDPHPPGSVRVRKSAMESPIHRDGRIDEIQVDLGGDPEDRLFLRGLFTYRAVTQPSRHVPILRGVLRGLLDTEGADHGSFRYKGVGNVFDSLPTEFLFTTPADDIREMVELVLDSETQQDVGVLVQPRGDGSVFCLVSMPKTFYSDDLRREVEATVRTRLRPTYVDQGLFVGRFDTLLLHYYLTGVEVPDDERFDAVETELRAMATPWVSRLWEAIAAVDGEARADHLVETYGRAFPEAWTRRTPAGRARADLECLDALSATRPILADLYEDADGEVLLTVYQTRNVYLTDILPILDDFGIRVRSSEAIDVHARGGQLHMDMFWLEADTSERTMLLAHRDVILDALPAVFGKRADCDPLNRLVVTAGLTWDEVDVIRGYTRYMRQLQVPVSVPRLQAILLSRPTLCRAIVDLFAARFDPDLDAREVAVRAASEATDVHLRRIRTHDEDVVFGGLADLVRATVRTNAFRTDRDIHYLSFKIAARQVRDMPGLRPLFEIYVHSREVEGVHLRFGRVARGGLRWSDRADYRTEVLSLVTTQQVKNVVIVPQGAKGGFFLREPADDRDARRAQADRLYQVFISGLLDVTDNRDGERVVPPPRVVRHDDDDPYLVVAADKGTAHLSDTANGISASYGFWLGDAFASGGSHGYDHKGVGITARGAWMLVRRHFFERGIDPYTEPFTCAGVGDMGGDVFGNGLLASRTTKLVAAFNHVHIFLDPEPDPEASYAERQRLFEAGGRDGGWDRYDKGVLGPGGGVFERSARVVELSPQARALLGIDAAEASPEEVIRAILTLDVDLLWCGGIGTYVKASHQTHADADDRANDRFRVDASQLRCKAVGEGANLSFTQDARIEASRAGVRMNTDFIDNSGGVDMSDHEVNLKILLSAPQRDGRLGDDDRNALLEALTDEVTDLVLANNDTHGRQLSRDEVRSARDIFSFGRAIAFVEQVHGLTREQLRLPTDDELAARAAVGEGLTRPELAVVSAWVKHWLRSQLLASGRVRDLEGWRHVLHGYFPQRIQDDYAGDVDAHPLADEIVATVVTTRVIADAGASFLPILTETTGRTAFEVVDAYLRIQRLARADDVRASLEELRQSVALRALNHAWVSMDDGCRHVIDYWLAAGNRVPTEHELSSMEEAIDQVYALQEDDARQRNAATIEALRDAGVSDTAAELVVKARYLDAALMVWSHAKRLDEPFATIGVSQIASGSASRVQAVIDHLRARSATGRWEPIAVQILSTRYVKLLRDLVGRLGPMSADQAIDTVAAELAEGRLAHVRAQVDTLMPEGEEPDLATLIVLEERLAGAIGRL